MKKQFKVLSLGVLLAMMVTGCNNPGGSDSTSQKPSASDVSASTSVSTSTSTNSGSTEKTLVSIEMENYPSPDPVKSVEEVDLTGVSITVNYSDTTSESIPVTKDMITWSDVVDGKATATVTYKGLKTTFVVNIEEEVVKTDLEYSFTIENGAVFQYDGTGTAPDIRVVVTSENADYEWYFARNDGAENLGQTIPTEPGTYTIELHLEGSKFYNDVHAFRWFKIVNKATPTIEFTFENGTEFTYDGTGKAPNIGATVLEQDVEFNTYFEKDEVKIGTSIPTEPGTYSFIVETVENDNYVATRAFRWFIIKSPTLLEPTITFGETTKFTYDGNPHTPTFSVSPEGLTYKIHYEQNEAFYSNEAPTAVGWYALIVEVEAGNGYAATKKWCTFEIKAAKAEPTVEFSFEAGTEFKYDGTGEAPNIGAIVLEDVEYITYFEENETNIGTTIPTKPGTYSLIVETTENDTYAAVRKYCWFKIVAPSAVEVIVTFSEEVDFTYDGNPHTPTFTVTPEGATYTCHYEKEEKPYSNDAPTEAGTYALIVNVEAGEGYDATTKWVVFRINAPEPASVSLKKTLPR